MTDRVHSLTVILEKPVRDDDVETLRDAIRQLRGVANVIVSKQNVEDHVSAVAREQARQEIRGAVSRVLWPNVLWPKEGA